MATAITTNGTRAVERITITPLNDRRLEFHLVGSAPYMQARFSEKALRQIREKQEAGSTAKKGTARVARDFEADYLGAMRLSEEGWHGIPASAFRAAAIDACRLSGYQMTRAKMSIFIVADGIDRVDGSPLVKITQGEPERSEMAVRNATGVADIRVRPMWRTWAVRLVMEFDGDQFTDRDIVNLMHRAGRQVGVGEGRPYSKSSNGIGFGTFTIVND